MFNEQITDINECVKRNKPKGLLIDVAFVGRIAVGWSRPIPGIKFDQAMV